VSFNEDKLRASIFSLAAVHGLRVRDHVRAAHDRPDVRLQLHRSQDVEAHLPGNADPSRDQQQLMAKMKVRLSTPNAFSNLGYMYP
ncbi:hypothetical protein CEXT_7981, partial [Caerostris extrusa]